MRMREFFKNRIWQSSSGVSLTELLTAILIMSLVMAGAAAGLTTAIRVYRQMTLKADAETLLGTTITVLTSELRTSSKNNLSGEGGAQTMEIYCEDQKMYLTFSNDPVNGIQVTADTVTADERGLNDPVAEFPLVSARTKTDGLYNEVTWDECENGQFLFTVTVRAIGAPADSQLASQSVVVQSMVTQTEFE